MIPFPFPDSGFRVLVLPVYEYKLIKGFISLSKVLFQYKDSRWAVDICETEGVIMKITDYYKLSSTAAVVLQKYSETWSDWIDIKVEDICDKDKIN